jgi:methyltransferase (TIGR00027 family)
MSRRLSSTQSNTAEINAAQRAIETLHPEHKRLLEDPYARYFVQEGHYRVLAERASLGRRALRVLDWRYPGLHAQIVLRVRYADEALADARRRGIDQLVLLGAGYDSTAFRTNGQLLHIFEVDAPPTQDAKLRAIERHGLVPLQPVRYAACDFELQSAGEVLAAQGFDRGRASLVVWLGVTCYLTPEAFERTLADMSAFAAPGSRLVLDYMDPDVIDGSTTHAGARRLARTVRRRGEPYLLGLTADDLEHRLGQAGFALRDLARTAELARRFGGAAGTWCRTEDFMGVATAVKSP